MTVEEAIWARVASLAGVITLAATRVYLDKLPQAPEYPAVRVTLVDDLDRYQLRGPDGARRARVQVDAYAEEDSGVDAYGQVTELSDAINGNGLGDSATGISGWRGTVTGLEILACFRLDRTRRYDPDELRVLTMTQDYFVWFRP